MVNNKLINIKPYAKPKKNGSGGASSITYNISGTDIGGDLNLKSLQANRIVTEYLEANNIQAGNTNTVNLVASDGTISSLRGDNLNYASGTIGDLNSNNIRTGNLTVDDTATIRNIFNKYLNSKEIVTDYLTVNKSAHFFEVVIDKIRSVGGTIINTATSCILDFVEPIEENGTITKYRCYWKQTNDDGNYVSNDWMVNDQAISQNCNLVAGINHDTGNHYYWRLVVGKQDETLNGRAYVNFTTGEVKNVSAVNGQYDAPKYEIVFVGSYVDEEQVEHQVSGFHYNNGEGEYIGEGANRRQNPYYDFTDWTYVCETGQEDWDDVEKKLTVQDTLHGLELLPNKRVDNVAGVQGGVVEYDAYISAGTLEFCTDYPTRLNTIIFFDDETIEFHAAPEKGQETTHYVINIEAATNAVVRKIVILSDEVDIWHACHWIELGNDNTNGKNEYDVPETHDDLDPNDPRYSDVLFGDEAKDWDTAPAKGDNIAQLGYRYSANPDADARSRASAIIIAAYKTPDSGGINGDRVIMPVYPPSYAQYQDITDFQLFTHRGTYMDRTGGYFKGKLVSESGTEIDIDNELTVDTEYYQIIAGESPIVKPSSGTKNVRFTILHVHNGVGTILDSQAITAFTLTVNNGNPISPQTNANYFNYPISYNTSDSQLNIKLMEGSTLKDNIILTIIDLGEVSDGRNGTTYEYKYKNAKSKPSDSEGRTTAYGWYDTATTPDFANGYYTWMSQRNSYYDSLGNETWTSWSSAVRITGDNGQAGEDGDFTEFIYTRNNTGTAPVAPPHGTYARDWPNNGTVDHQTVNGVTWYDRPQGVQADIRYEYVSSREYDGISKTWTDYSTPVVWAKYGEKGMDGDGVEYIFKAYNINPLPNTYKPSYNDYNNKTFTDDDFVPSGWSDDPMSPTESLPYVFVSQRKQINGEWVKPTSTTNPTNGSMWSPPALWAKWSKDGDNGEPGTQGDPGEDGTNDKLIPIYQVWEVRTTSSSDYNDIVSKLYTNLKFKVFHIEGETVTEQQRLPDAGYKISATVYANSGATLKTYYYNSSSSSVSMTCTSEDNGSLNRFNLSFDNMLSNIYSATTKQDYRKLSQASTVNTELPVRMIVQLTLNGTVVDQKEYEVTFKAGHVFEVTDAALNSAFFGNWKDSNGNTVNGMSSIRQDMTGIQTNVSSLTTDLGNLQSDYSTFKQTAQGFQTKVESDYYDNQGNATINQSSIEQTAQSISAAVQTDIEGKLKRTGIDISNGLINIASDNTTIGGNVYIHGGVLKSNGLISSVDVSAYCTWSGKVNTTTSNYAFTTNKTTIGTFTAGDKITISNLYKNLIQTDLRGQQSDQSSLLGTVTYNIYRDSTLFTSFTSKPSSALSITTGGTYYLEVTSSASLTGSYGYTFNGGLAMTLVKNTVVEMADNGINLAVADSSSNRHYMRFSPDTIESAIFEVGTYATENGSQHFPLGGLRIANGMPQQRIANQTYGNTTSLPKYYRVESAGLWGSLGSQLAVKNCSTNSEHPIPQVDFYIYTETRPTNGVFDLTVTGNEILNGLYTGRIIRIKGYNGLVVKCPTKIIRKNQYYGGDTKSQQIKMGSGSNSNFDSTNGKVIDYYSLTLILVGTIWYEI